MKKIYVLFFTFLFFAVNVQSQVASDLFFSEYVEGTSNNKAIEIFNGTGATVDLSLYRVTRSNNGATAVQDSINFASTLLNNDVYVIANPSLDTSLVSIEDTTHTITFYNGDDVLQLQKSTAGGWVTIDIIGTLGQDPGTAWPVAGVTNATAEYSLIRKSTVLRGNTSWVASAGSDSLNSEWLVYPQNYFSNLGMHRLELPLITIAEARIDANADGIPDRYHRADSVVHIQGVVFTPNYQTVNRSYYIWDGTAGIATFKLELLSPALNMGDKVDIVGFIVNFNSLAEITPLSDSSIIVLSDSNTTPNYQVLTIPQFLANPESYEGELIAIKNLTRPNGGWPGTGLSANLTFKNGSDSIVVRIDSDTDIDGKTQPVYPIDIIGVVTQFSGGATNVGYQLQPRFYGTDFLPGGTIPVELTSFTANYSGSRVSLNWVTASEKNNRGFEIQKKSSGTFETVAFIQGNGTTTEKHTYSYSDKDVKTGTYTYRLKQVDFDGSFAYSKEAAVEVVQPKVFALNQNYPNPFNPSTTINFSLAVDSKISLKLFNILGQEITTLINSSYTAGAHEIMFNASLLNSGIYFYKLEASGIDGSAFSSVKKMMLTK